MSKSAGFLKKLKKVGKLIGKGASWVNNNVIKPLNPIIDTALDFVPYGNTIKQVKDIASNVVDEFAPQAPTNRRVQDGVRFIADVGLDTQRSRADRKYLSYDDDYEEDYAPPPRKAYRNPFGKRIN